LGPEGGSRLAKLLMMCPSGKGRSDINPRGDENGKSLRTTACAAERFDRLSPKCYKTAIRTCPGARSCRRLAGGIEGSLGPARGELTRTPVGAPSRWNEKK